MKPFKGQFKVKLADFYFFALGTDGLIYMQEAIVQQEEKDDDVFISS